MKEEQYMKLAIELARKGIGFVNPNPLVGAVVVKNDVIIGKGYHERYGGLHAERNAFLSCVEPLEGATLYVTLEPCCHYGKTPPCTESIIQNKIKRVVIGTKDPNPMVAGKGIKQLQEAGIEVKIGVLEEECVNLNEKFFYYIKHRIPFVALKYAMTMDGKIATSTGMSRWITGESARNHVHQLRHEYTAIMVGIGTVMKDNPMLNCRLEGGRSPIRIVCDTELRIDLKAELVTTAKSITTYIATSNWLEEKVQKLEEAGVHVILVEREKNGVNLPKLMKKLGELRIDSVLLEGGAKLSYSALENHIVNKVYAYIAPKFFGGEMAKTPVGGSGVSRPEEAFYLEKMEMKKIGEDWLLEGRIKGGEQCLLD